MNNTTLLRKRCIFFLFLLVLAGTAGAQNVQRHKIAVFTPLYLDSVFDASGNYRYDKSFPKFLNPGLEFYQGAQLALDSLQKRGAPLEVFFIDSRARRRNLQQQLNSPNLRDVSLFIAQSNVAETRLLADAAQKRKIPFVSATLPNDGGITNNPYLVVLNSTLQTHVESIYRYLQRNHANDRIVVFRKNGVQEDMIRDYLNDFSKTTTTGKPLSLKFVNLSGAFSGSQLAAQLDSTRRTVVIAGSLDANFGTALAEGLNEMRDTYPVLLFGMPTWDNFDFDDNAFGELEIIYTTPFFYSRSGGLGRQIADEFSDRIGSRPTDMFFRGYETMLRFSLLLLDTRKDIASNLTRKGNTVFSAFDIQPTFKDRSAMTLDYFENKKLYFIKVMAGNRNVLQ